MKMFLGLILLLSVIAIPVEAAGPRVTADSALLIEVEDGRILWEKQSHQPRPPASTTKVLTALMALEMGDGEEEVVISQRAGNTGESSINLFPGEKTKLGVLITGALVRSGNDACVAISEHIAGSEEMYTLWMTAKARLLGAKNSQFFNTHGLPNKQHLSSAYDLAAIARYAVRNPEFSQIVKQKTAHLDNREGWPKTIRNTNRLLWSYPFADGVKTGTTNAAGKCLVASATKGNRRLIAVVLHSDDRVGDCLRMFEYGFSLN